jgi:hypothetical protein
VGGGVEGLRRTNLDEVEEEEEEEEEEEGAYSS